MIMQLLTFIFIIISILHLMINSPTSITKYILIITLIVQFWISGLFVLSVIFTQDSEEIDDLTLCTFIAYAIGSFLAGILSDIFGRRPLFIIATVILTLSSAIIIEYQFYGYILANLAIGPLNNLTFVYINEVYPQSSEKFTISVLVGWAFSQITLGVFFYFLDSTVFFFFLLTVTIVYAIVVLMHVKETDEFIKSQSKLKQQKIQSEEHKYQQTENNNPSSSYENSYKQALLPAPTPNRPSSSEKSFKQNNKFLRFCQNKIIPTSLKPLIGCSILMFTMQMFYYRTQFTLDTFGISLQLNTIVVGCTEVFSNILFAVIIKSIKRKQALRLLILALMILLVFLIVSTEQWVQTVIQGFMRLFDTGIMIVLGVYIPQLFPINERGRGTNFIMSFGVIGSALNGKLFRHFPFWSLEFFLLSALSMTLFLKQTQTKKRQSRYSINYQKQKQNKNSKQKVDETVCKKYIDKKIITNQDIETVF